MNQKAVWPRIVLVGLVVFVLDILTKQAVVQNLPERHSIVLIDGFLNLHHIKNTGAAFGLGTGLPTWIRFPLFVGFFFLALWVMYGFYQRCKPEHGWLKVSLGLVSGGAFGNMLDRVFYGKVTDFIDVHWFDIYHWPFFNVADMGITVGIAMLFVHVWLWEEKEQVAEQTAGS